MCLKNIMFSLFMNVHNNTSTTSKVRPWTKQINIKINTMLQTSPSIFLERNFVLNKHYVSYGGSTLSNIRRSAKHKILKSSLVRPFHPLYCFQRSDSLNNDYVVLYWMKVVFFQPSAHCLALQSNSTLIVTNIV